tara:strand:+ start:611 stop:751 length:141 start_codon:yes stop_codon:yes gene_type:complete
MVDFSLKAMLNAASSPHADMAELVDATDLKSVDLLIVRVRFPLSVF